MIKFDTSTILRGQKYQSDPEVSSGVKYVVYAITTSLHGKLVTLKSFDGIKTATYKFDLVRQWIREGRLKLIEE